MLKESLEMRGFIVFIISDFKGFPRATIGVIWTGRIFPPARIGPVFFAFVWYLENEKRFRRSTFSLDLLYFTSRAQP